MAGDLYIESIDEQQMINLKAAGATVTEAIYHADRPFYEHQDRLNTQLQPGALNSRLTLPAHAYVRFDAANRSKYDLYVNDPVKRLRMDDFLKKCTRPLGLVSANAHLANWPGNTVFSAALMLQAALQNGAVTIEYYKLGGRLLLSACPGWAKHNE
jgi:hypothetical protein